MDFPVVAPLQVTFSGDSATRTPHAEAATRFDALLCKIKEKHALVGIIGLGYVGLPLARAFTEKGFAVLGFDTDSQKVARLQRGESYIKHIAPEIIATMRANRFEATDRFEGLTDVDVVILCVPTPLTDAREPDMTYIESSARAVAATLRPSQLVILESTTYPGTTRQVVLPILEASGLRAGKDFYLAYSPEREDPGNPSHSAPLIPKVVGAIDAASLELAASVYAQVVCRVVRVRTPETAEACKILENTYRCVNIALVNELKVLYDRMGIDVWEVIEAASSKPFGYQPFYPGPGLGGHCIPIDPFYLTWVARKHGLSTRFIELAGEVNTSMPAYVVSRVIEALNDVSKPIRGSKITLLGMAYKKDVDDPRESPGYEVMELLMQRGAVVQYNDPHIPQLRPIRHHGHFDLESQPLTPGYLRSQDCLVIVTDHSAYDWDWIVSHAPLVVDTRNATRHVSKHRERVVRA
jgi:UDP-N-acetyl-D-glucosamine dehydrogenase